MHGHAEKVLQLFSRMKQEGFAPGKCLPQIGHYGSMIDLFGLVGRLMEVFRRLQSMPLEPKLKCHIDHWIDQLTTA
ncbi:hypothetical protein ACSBR2_024780 [Camellia fascicularis]